MAVATGKASIIEQKLASLRTPCKQVLRYGTLVDIFRSSHALSSCCHRLGYLFGS